MTDIEQEVQEVLEQEDQGVSLEDVPNEQSSPLNQAVKEKDIAGTSEQPSGEDLQDDLGSGEHDSQEPLDAPEQDIRGESTYQFEPPNQEEFDMPKSTAGMAADAILGSINNYIGVGAGFFIRIRKHKEFFEFEDIIRIVDEQNEKNIQRIKFDEEDLALLRPILMQVIQKRAKKLTPEQQLLSVLLSIMVKKAQVIVQIRAENELLTERILDIIREEKGTHDTDHMEVDSEEEATSDNPTDSSEERPVSNYQEEYEEESHLGTTVLEVAEEQSKQTESQSE